MSTIILNARNAVLFAAAFYAVSLVAADNEPGEAAFGTPFTSHAVLQRDCKIPVWGTATPGCSLSVKFDDLALEATAGANGKWRVDFPPMKPGKGHALTLTSGERLARLALSRTYGFGNIVEAGPIPKLARARGGNVAVSFKNSNGLKTSDGGKVRGFELAGADRKFARLDAKIVKDKIVVAAPDGMTPKFVRYAWDDYPDCNLVNAEGLPCGSFELEIEEKHRKEKES